jgi:hypothetical protein
MSAKTENTFAFKNNLKQRQWMNEHWMMTEECILDHRFQVRTYQLSSHIDHRFQVTELITCQLTAPR